LGQPSAVQNRSRRFFALNSKHRALVIPAKRGKGGKPKGAAAQAGVHQKQAL